MKEVQREIKGILREPVGQSITVQAFMFYHYHYDAGSAFLYQHSEGAVS
jgi:hypothetical protein